MDLSMNPFYTGFLINNAIPFADKEEYLASLDSDTRDYVMKNTKDLDSIDEIRECINRLHKDWLIIKFKFFIYPMKGVVYGYKIWQL